MTWFSIFVLIHALLVTLLAMNISRLRISLQVGNGDGGHAVLRRAIRAHGNAVEHVLLFGFLVLALALEQAAGWIQAVLVSSFALSRFLHAYAMLAPQFRIRTISAGLCYLVELAALAVLALALI